MTHIQERLKLIMEGSIIESAELNLKNEKWCTCTHPSGPFRYITSEGHEQIWRHIDPQCNGLVLRPMYPDKR